MKKLAIPYGAGVGSAIGLLAAPQRLDVSVTRIVLLDESGGAAIEKQIGTLFAELEANLSRQVVTMGYELGDFSLARHVSGRLAGQGFEIKVPLNEERSEGATDEL